MAYEINPKVKIGHIHLTVSNLDKALSFYRDLLGFQVTARFGTSAVFLSSGGYHHHIALNTWAGENAPQPPKGTTGLYHFAILYPSRKELAQAFKKIWEEKYPIEGASDHGVSESVYLKDPDGNGVELYADRPFELWPKDEDGNILMITKPLDLPNLLSELE
ncbi:MAG: VOC family protein [Ignavibacterium sp.]